MPSEVQGHSPGESLRLSLGAIEATGSKKNHAKKSADVSRSCKLFHFVHVEYVLA